MSSIFSSLNEQQRSAVVHEGSPLLILAGPGSGKTTVITAKIARLIHESGFDPAEILAMTFTNKAAREMVERVQCAAGLADRKPYISTFHSFGAYMLRYFSDEVQLEKDFQIYDAEDQLALLKQAQPSLDVSKAKGLLSGISAAKDHGLTEDVSDAELENFVFKAEFFRAYERAKKNTGNVDFGDLLVMPYLLLRRENIKKIVQQWWRWFLIDEYQDTNRVQFLLLRELCGHTTNLCVVGDDDQSIYKFRGAVVENILTFQTAFPNTEVIKLEQNYRSTPQILNFANVIIAPNKTRHGKRIFSMLPDSEKPKLVLCADEDEEHNFIVHTVRSELGQGNMCALFFRTNAQSRAYETALRSARIAYTLVGAASFFMRAEVKDVLALARVFRNTRDVVSFLRIANKPVRGLGARSLQSIAERMRAGATWQESYEELRTNISSSACAGFGELVQLFASAREEKADTIGGVCEFLVRRSGIADFYKKKDRAEGTDRMRNIEEFLSYAFDSKNTDEGWIQFLEQVSLAESAPHEESDRVQLMTLHRSKGLEFDAVIMCGVEDDVIPLTYFVDDRSSLEETVEEERRLFYVGITRAKKHLYLTVSQMRRRFGTVGFCRKSQFLADAQDCVETVSLAAADSSAARGSFSRRHSTAAKYQSRAQGQSLETSQDTWKEGDRVRHKDYGHGVVRTVRRQGAHVVLRVEFDSEFESDFMPQFDASIRQDASAEAKK